jgi:hypothetical protein
LANRIESSVSLSTTPRRTTSSVDPTRLLGNVWVHQLSIHDRVNVAGASNLHEKSNALAR